MRYSERLEWRAASRTLLIVSRKIESENYLFAVRDSGPRLNPEHVDCVFDPFRTTKPGGTGMGLAFDYRSS